MTGQTLERSEAFEDLRQAVGGELTPHALVEPAFARLKFAIAATGSATASQLDLLVLLRHALRHREGQLTSQPVMPVPIWRGWHAGAIQPVRCGIETHEAGGSVSFHALPWRPEWLAGIPHDGVDGSAAAADAPSGSPSLAG